MSKSCLIVDDSRAIRLFTRGILQKLGFEITEAEDGKKAIAACEKAMPDFIMLDWNMPVMNGIDFLRYLRTMPGNRATKVFFCTTESELSRITEAIGSGADEYIMKPFDGEILASKLAMQGLLE
jgi:two-component system, chemotaxis family, chemotaxis protein CheY